MRSRRAAAPVSSSASTTTRPPTMCSPPANRSSDDTSDRRQHVFETASRLSSSLTAAVIATMTLLSHLACPLPQGHTAHAGVHPTINRRTRSPIAVPRARKSIRYGPTASASRRLSPSATGSCRVPRPGRRDRVEPQPGAERLRRTSQAVRRRHGVGVGDHRVDPQPGRVLAEYVQMPLRGEPGGLTRLRDQVQYHHAGRRRVDQCLVQLRHQQVRQHAGEPRAGSEQHHVRVEHGLDRRLARLRHLVGPARGLQPDPLHPAGRGRHRDLAPDPPHRRPGPRRGRPRPPRCRAVRCTSAARDRSAPAAARPRSSAATGSPRISSSAASTRLPTACPASAPVPPNRCWNTVDHSEFSSSSPASAASALRRSPGGNRPSSRRSLPDDPPSSATVTTAVTSGVSRRSADSVT